MDLYRELEQFALAKSVDRVSLAVIYSAQSSSRLPGRGAWHSRCEEVRIQESDRENCRGEAAREALEKACRGRGQR